MKLEASPGNVVLRFRQPDRESKVLLPDNVAMEEFPTFEIVCVGEGRTFESGFKETIPYNRGDRVIVAAGRCMPVKADGETLYIAAWTLIFAKVMDD